MTEAYIRAAEVIPSKRQLEWQKTEMYAFCHFGMNTFTDKEWGDGTDSPALFNPTDFDADQWARVIKNGGLNGIILTCKHHDGFCLWPSKYTDYSVKASPFKDGSGDIVREVSSACKKHGLKFGVYLSPWDRHEKTYGEGKAYDTYFVNQLTELLTDYGDIFCVWFDGACGEGKNGRIQQYDWPGYYKVIRELMPDAVISICGPDVRWIGNETAVCRESEWSVVPSRLAINEYTAEHSQKSVDEKIRDRYKMELDLGSRKAIKNEKELIWYPAEVDVSVRPGWFYHKSEDYRVKSYDKLVEIYLNSVGGNANLLLNIPPDKTGRIHEIDALALDSFARSLRDMFYNKVSEGSKVKASSELDELHRASNILSDNGILYWQCAADDKEPEIVIDFGEEKSFDSVVLKENIATGQQIESFALFINKKGKWKRLCKGTVIGYKKIVRLKKKVSSDKLRIKITSYRVKAALEKVEIYASREYI